MKLVIMIVGALVVLAGGGVGAYFYFMQPAEASSPESEEGEEAKKKKKEKKKKEDKEKQVFEYVELDPLVLPIVDKSGVSQVVSMVIALEIMGSKEADMVKSIAPRLKDAYIQDLYGMLNEHAALKGGIIQVGYIKKRLNKISQDVVPDGEINDVLLQVVQQRPI